MDDRIIADIKAFVQRHPPPKLAPNVMLAAEEFRRLGYTPQTLFPVASPAIVAKAEAGLGFALPSMLKRLFLEVSNGIAGFAYDILGLEGGCASDCGNLLDTYREFKTYDESLGTPWMSGLLPICNWGSTIYSCVDCNDSALRVYTHESAEVWPERYTLNEFFEMWLNGKVEFSQEDVEIVTKEVNNPFTGQKTTFSARTRRKRGS